MFKAKLIDDPAYYKLRKKLIILGLPGAVLLGLFFGQVQVYLPYFIGTLILIGFFLAWRIRTHKQASSMVRNRSIEISPETIRILSGHGKILETIPVSDLSGLMIKETYALPDESIQDLVRELQGNGLENYMVIHQGEEERRFDFFLDSHYMIVQLKKVIADWQSKGLKLQSIN